MPAATTVKVAGAGGITVLLITREKTRGAGDQEMRGLTSLCRRVGKPEWAGPPLLPALESLTE